MDVFAEYVFRPLAARCLRAEFLLLTGLFVLPGCSQGSPAESPPESPAEVEQREENAEQQDGGVTRLTTEKLARMVADAGGGLSGQERIGEQLENQTLEIEGTVVFAGRGDEGDEIMLRGTDPATSESVNVKCFTKDKRPWLKATHGQRAIIRGVKRSRFAFQFKLVDAVILQVEGEPVPDLTAEEVSAHHRESAANPAEKDEIKHFFVRGRVVKIDTDKEEVTRLNLDVETAPAVVCVIPGSFDPPTYVVGQQVRFLATYYGKTTDKEVELHFCLPADR
jgi:hypothetical protein